MAVRDLPRQPRRLRRLGLPHRPAHRHLPASPRHRLRPLPQRPNRLDLTPDELTGGTTKLTGLSRKGGPASYPAPTVSDLTPSQPVRPAPMLTAPSDGDARFASARVGQNVAR